MIPFTYEVIESTERGMTIRYNSPGRTSVDIGTHAPTPLESVHAIAMQYSPLTMWLDQDAERIVVPVGTSGSYEPPVPQQPTLESARADKLAELADWRYRQEISGVFIGGARIKTDRESQATINSAFTSLSQGFITSVDWKADGGVWIKLTAEQLTPIAIAVATHVQACFTAEKELAAEINALQTIEQIQAFSFPDLVVQ